MPDLDLTTLHSRCRLSQVLLGAYVEAASVVLAAHHASPPPTTAVAWQEEGSVDVATINWTEPGQRAKESHANVKDATEYAAYAVAIEAMEAQGFRVIRRAIQGSGADFLMIREGEPENDFYKLEVSGIFQGGDVKLRLRQKVEQVGGGMLDRPGRAVVVQFEQPAIAVGRWA